VSVPRSRFRNHPRTIFSSLGKLLMSLGISPISMFNLSFALVHLYILQLNTGISFAILRQVSQFCNFEVYVTRPKTKVNDMLTRREKAESITVSTRLPKASTIDKSCKCLPVTILTVLLKLGCSNIEETRNKISDSPRRRLRLRRISSRSRKTVQLLCIHRDLVLSLRRSTSPFSYSTHSQSFVNPSKRLECHDCFYQS